MNKALGGWPNCEWCGSPQLVRAERAGTDQGTRVLCGSARLERGTHDPGRPPLPVPENRLTRPGMKKIAAGGNPFRTANGERE